MPTSTPSGPEFKSDASHRNGKAKESLADRAQSASPARQPAAKWTGFPLRDVMDHLPHDGGALRWGLAVALGGPVSPVQWALSELAAGRPLPKKAKSIDWQQELNSALSRFDVACTAASPDPLTVLDGVLWLYAMPALRSRLGDASITVLGGSLEQLHRHCVSLPDASRLSRLLGGGELGMLLALQYGGTEYKARMGAAMTCLKEWCESPEASIGFAVQCHVQDVDPFREPVSGIESAGTQRAETVLARAVLASLIRARAIALGIGKQKLKKHHLDTVGELATWIAATTRSKGTAAFSTATAKDVRDDTAKHGLFHHLKQLDPECLGPALDAAAGASQTGGRLAWEISLPESYCHSELGGTAVLLPEWDVRRGRIYIDYSQSNCRLQLEAGKLTVVDGVWELLVQVDGQEQAAAGPWTSLCEYSDDDVHYLEIEQRWTGGIRVQRHLLLIRDDRCVMLADAVIREEGAPPAQIHYVSRLQLAKDARVKPEVETTELWLQDETEKARALVMSLQSSEWRVGPSRARLDITPDHHLRLELSSDRRNQHGGNLFAPLWFDLQQRRFKRPRTWRQLTVVEDLRLVDPDEAAAFRVQVGSEQWVLYRMLYGDRTRTFLGKHLLADLFCGRFHASDGSVEDLVTVGGAEDEEATE